MLNKDVVAITRTGVLVLTMHMPIFPYVIRTIEDINRHGKIRKPAFKQYFDFLSKGGQTSMIDILFQTGANIVFTN